VRRGKELKRRGGGSGSGDCDGDCNGCCGGGAAAAAAVVAAAVVVVGAAAGLLCWRRRRRQATFVDLDSACRAVEALDGKKARPIPLPLRSPHSQSVSQSVVLPLQSVS
jgi:hypothetical protein